MLRRMFALFLILAVFCGLLPLTAWAEEEATVEDPTVLAGELAEKLRALPIPVNQRQTVTYGNSHELAGTYFIAVKAGNSYYALDHSASVSTKGVLHRAKDSTENRPQTAFSALGLTVSGDQILGQSSLRNAVTLDYWREPITYYYKDAENTYYSYTLQEWKTNSKTTTTDGCRVYTVPIPAADAAYTLRFSDGNYLIPNGSGEALKKGSSAYPFMIQANSNGTLTAYKMHIHGTNQFTYWLGMDTKDSNRFTLATRAQMRRNDASKGFSIELQLFRLSPVTMELYRTLQELLPYVQQGNTGYGEESYSAFLSLLQEAIELYTAHSQVYSDSGLQKTLEAKAEALRLAVKKLRYGEEGQTLALAYDVATQIRELYIPIARQKKVTSSNRGALNGTYFMIIKSGSTYYAMNPDVPVTTNGVLHRASGSTANVPQSGFAPVAIAMSDGAIRSQKSLQYTVKLEKWSGTVTYYSKDGTTYQSYNEAEWKTNSKDPATDPKLGYRIYTKPDPSKDPGYTLCFGDGKYLSPKGNKEGLQAGASSYPYFFQANADGTATVYKMHIGGVNQFTYWLGADTDNSLNFTTATRPQMRRNDADRDFIIEFYLYQVSPVSLGLYSALKEMLPYVEQGNAAGYDTESYGSFVSFLAETVEMYQKHRTVFSDSLLQSTLQGRVTELRAAAKELEAGLAHAMPGITTLHQLPVMTPNADYAGEQAQNMAYIMQTAEGKIIVIDGGRRGDEALYLLSYLRNLTGKEIPHVDAWIHTHAHSDHVYAYLDIAQKYPNAITLDRLYCNYPTEAEFNKYCADNNPASMHAAVQSVYNATKLLKNDEGGPVEILELNSRHTGKCNSSFDIDEIHFDVLLTFDDMIAATKTMTGTYTCTMDTHNTNYDKKTIADMMSHTTNNTTMVCRATVGGRSILFLGDAAAGCSIVLEAYHKANKSDSAKYFSLKSDIVQMAHHGGRNGQSKAVYQAIDPDISLWPCTGVTHEATGGSAASSTNPKKWLSDLGAEIYPAYKGPQVFYFGTPRNAATVSIPEKLKPYVFDATYYADRYPELKAVYGTEEAKLYDHFLTLGIAEGRCASPYFDVAYYANHNNINLTEYVKGDYEKAMSHFISYMDNATEMSNAPKRLSVHFDPAYYRSQYGDLASMTTEFQLLQHYGSIGNAEGRRATSSALSANKVNYHHSCTFTQVDAVCHRVLCSSCGGSYTQSHSYVYGLCACGMHEIREPVEEPTLKLNHSLNLAGDISVNLLLSKSLLEGFDMDSVYVESRVERYEGAVLTETTTHRLLPVEQGNYYYFTLDGLTAVEMNNRISSVLYGSKEGQPYYSPTDVYSIATYAYSQLNKTGSSNALKTLCADLLRYGAKAQIYKNYRTDSLADSAMTETHRAYLSDMEAVTFGNTNTVLNDLDNAPILWAGKALNLESKVALKLIFRPNAYEGNLSDLRLHISYRDVNGNEKTLTLKEPEQYNEEKGLYAFTLSELLAAELRTVVSAQIYEGQSPLSATLQYSPDTYGNNKTGNLLTLCKALFAYSDSAKAYFIS